MRKHAARIAADHSIAIPMTVNMAVRKMYAGAYRAKIDGADINVDERRHGPWGDLDREVTKSVYFAQILRQKYNGYPMAWFVEICESQTASIVARGCEHRTLGEALDDAAYELVRALGY